nr:hypothetical protein [Crucivirus sp.]
MANFYPNRSACSDDRWEIHTLTGDPIMEQVHDTPLENLKVITACNTGISDSYNAAVNLPITSDTPEDNLTPPVGSLTFPDGHGQIPCGGGVRGEPPPQGSRPLSGNSRYPPTSVG